MKICNRWLWPTTIKILTFPIPFIEISVIQLFRILSYIWWLLRMFKEKKIPSIYFSLILHIHCLISLSSVCSLVSFVVRLLSASFSCTSFSIMFVFSIGATLVISFWFEPLDVTPSPWTCIASPPISFFICSILLSLMIPCHYLFSCHWSACTLLVSSLVSLPTRVIRLLSASGFTSFPTSFFTTLSWGLYILIRVRSTFILPTFFLNRYFLMLWLQKSPSPLFVTVLDVDSSSPAILLSFHIKFRRARN